MPASADPNSDKYGGFIDIDELLSGRQHEGPRSVDSDHSNMADIVDDRTQGSSPTDCSRSTTGSSQGELPAFPVCQDFILTMPDPVILGDSDDESVSAKSETDYSSFEVNLAAKSDPSPLHIADNDVVDSEGFCSGTTYISDHTVANHQEDDNDSGIVDGARL